ncbi:hypothetical protein PF006_g5861 [Phytophthora fragariae]|uniref:Uncharacterized protein n=1 Tax=Phytophthora fragariae TaxID=53985 RepID=A0A6A3UHU4_9STRA|nr:hypothetical protein PF006_g5861 [Phytophthora fragariae]
MEDEEDTYGFGSFSELFDAGASQAQKRLDLGALSRFCMSERLLSRFQQQQRQDKRCAVFQHVAAKFNGVGIDGGLGALSVAALEGGGVVWLQTEQSDSDALKRRKKELQDITNRAPQETKSAAALFVAVELVAEVLPTTVQNTVQGVEMKLSDGNRLELTFMPGPFAGVTHRDEFLQTLKKLMADGKEEASAEHAAAIPAESESAKEEVGGGDLQSQVDSEASDAAQREKFRQLVRRYTTVDPLSDEGIAIAKQVHAGTGYHLGPMAKQIPKFSADSEYRKKTVAELSSYLNRMNQEWGEADSHRELHTKAKHSRNDDDLFEYTDTDTGAQIPARAYEQRYLEYAKAHEVNPVLHLCPDQGEKMKRDTTALNGALDAHHSAPTTSSTVAEEEARSASAYFIATLGFDVSKSCIIDEDFFSAAENVPVSRVEGDPAFRAAVDRKRAEIWKSWGDTFARVRGSRVSTDEPPPRASEALSVSRAAGKRSRERRRSLVLPNPDELRSTADANVSNSSERVNYRSTEGESARSGMKRSRPTSLKSDPAQRSRRKERRQSIVSTVSLPPAFTSEDEQKKTPRSSNTPRSTRKSPRPTHPANGYAREASALEMVADQDADLCKLCYSEQALVHMNPCAHAVCVSCWSRLSPSEHDQIDRQHRRVQLAAMQRFPHKPKLSRHTQEICAAQRNHDMDKLTDHCRRHHERLDACTRQVRYTVPPSSSGSCNQSYVSSIPFSLLIEALDQQEQRMRFIIKCA